MKLFKIRKNILQKKFINKKNEKSRPKMDGFL